tara:strand:- start:41 stop:1513 length:1473 start_codon:yes stop_codon:yes gene_type:complete
MTTPNSHDNYFFRWQLPLIFLLCVGSRLLTAIYYLEDIDSMRFAMAAIEYDVLANKPHFPGYPVFCLLLGCFHDVLNSVALSFALSGGLATFSLIVAIIFSTQLLNYRGPTWSIIVLILFNPLFWLMSNRYMPDLFGLSVLYWSLFFLLKMNVSSDREQDNSASVMLGISASLLAGIRLSYLPFLLPAVFYLRNFRQFKTAFFSFFLTSVFWISIWAYVSGAQELFELAIHDVNGHFFQWGGTIYSTDASWLKRFNGAFEGIFAHGLGFWWTGRSNVTLLNSFVIIYLLATGLIKFRFQRLLSRPLSIWILCALSYFCWAFFFQNITYKPRHILPILPPLLVALAHGLESIRLPDSSSLFQFAKYMLLVPYATCGIYLAVQHLKPSALDQFRSHVLDDGARSIIYCPEHLQRFYLRETITGKELVFAKNVDEVLRNKWNRPLVMSSIQIPALRGCELSRANFYHNPYVNKLWSELTLFTYEIDKCPGFLP